MSAKQVLIGTISGLVAGAVVGLLLAPQSGAETRQKISDSADQLKKKLRKLRGQASEDLDDLKAVFENEVEGLKDDVRAKVLKLIETSKAKYASLKDEVSSN